ncbi:DUF6691 family protein [Halobacteriovorax sp. JY17]|uniref:DUF6691 family protein n=1 Tax=Halobacteriovorax sp. JY17 TaxID=2014617 RepID=UPI000C41DB5A|nr:DUF6691 family protein [Halobacteriovorax sp. JY17]PIK13605.1 MAG: YeeE/YedE family protein [Halobacteriovorax sp. JY17]
MVVYFISLLSGVLFSVGLIISEMVNPAKVIGFLDIFGEWDYSLVFVMLGAISVNLVVFKFVKKEKPIFNGVFHLPTRNDIDWRLLTGSVLFGVGWGMAGICPGPAIVNLASMNSDMLLFFVSMISGMIIYKYLNRFIKE